MTTNELITRIKVSLIGATDRDELISLLEWSLGKARAIKPDRNIAQLNTMITSLCVELDSLPCVKSSHLIDDDDEYQDNLELGWHQKELQSRLDVLELERIALWRGQRDDLRNECELNSLENQSNEQ